MKSRLNKLFKDEQGATAVEYSLMATGIALVVMSAVGGIGLKLETFLSEVSAGLK